MVKESELFTGSDSSLRNKVFKYLKSHILGGDYKPGESLVESKLAEEMGVSRTPIREAIRLLEVEGLVETVPNKGAVILGVSEKDVEDIYAIRQLVEGLAARWATKNMTEEDKHELQNIIDLMEFYSHKEDLSELAKLDNQFHQIIYDASGSKILNLTLSNLHQYVQLARLRSLKVPCRLSHTISEHRNILKSFLENDPAKAEAALADHVKKAYLNIHDEHCENK